MTRVAGVPRRAARRWWPASLLVVALAPAGRAGAVATLVAPADGSVVPGVTISFSFEDVDATTGCDFLVATDSAFQENFDLVPLASPGACDTGVGTATVDISPFADAGHVHYWTIRTCTAGGSCTQPPPFSFTNGPSATPSVPILTSPIGGADVPGTAAPLHFEVLRAFEFQLQIATDPGFTDIIADSGFDTLPPGDSFVFTLSVNDNGAALHWRIRGRNSLGTSAFTGDFFVNGPSGPPGVPVPLFPVGGENVPGTDVELLFDVPGGLDARVEVANDAGFTEIVADTDWTRSELPGLTFPLVFFDDGGEFHWRLRSRNPLGETAPVAEHFVNGPSAPPEIPTLLLPVDDALVPGTTIGFSWEMPRGLEPQLQIARDSAFQDIVFDDGFLGRAVRGATIGNFDDNGEELFWRVRSTNPLGTTPYSAPNSLVNGPSGPPLAPGLLSPPDGLKIIAAQTSIEFSWSPAARAFDYRFELARDPGFQDIAFSQVTPETVSDSVTLFEGEGQTFHWRVTARNSAGSATSAVFELQDGDDTQAPVVTAPPDLGVEATAVLTPIADLGAASAVDNIDGPLTPAPDDAGPFPLGLTVVTWSATDAAGNTGTDTQNVTVVDTTAPVLSVPPDVQVTAAQPVPVDLGTATATDIFSVTIANDAPALFPVGVTAVTWTATDTSGNASDDTQNVTVSLPPSDGDVNGDGAVDAADLLQVLRIVSGEASPTPEEAVRADVAPLVGGAPAPDGEVDVADALVIARKVAGDIDF